MVVAVVVVVVVMRFAVVVVVVVVLVVHIFPDDPSNVASFFALERTHATPQIVRAKAVA